MLRRPREHGPDEPAWVTPPAPHLVCSACHEPFTDPVTRPCGDSFCRACAAFWFDGPSTQRCPGRCEKSAEAKAAATTWALKEGVDALRVHCCFGLRASSRGAWEPDPEGCPEHLRRADVAAHEATCGFVIELCPFAGCGTLRRRRDADAHDAEAAAAHAHNERALRRKREAQLRSEREAHHEQREACEELARALDRERAVRQAMQARMQAHLEDELHSDSDSLLRSSSASVTASEEEDDSESEPPRDPTRLLLLRLPLARAGYWEMYGAGSTRVSKPVPKMMPAGCLRPCDQLRFAKQRPGWKISVRVTGPQPPEPPASALLLAPRGTMMMQ